MGHKAGLVALLLAFAVNLLASKTPAAETIIAVSC